MASASALPNLYQGVEKGSFGYKMLANMGWKEGEGLGATKQGIKEHVKVKKKQDASGVGAAEHVQKLRDWTTGMVGFDAILTGLKEVTRQDHSSSSGQGHSSGYDSDSDTSAEVVQAKQERKDAAKGKGYKTVAGKKRRKSADPEIDNEQKASKKAKRQKQSAPVKSGKKGDHSVAPDSTARPSNPNSDSKTDGEAGIAAAAAAAAGSRKVSRVRAATHLGRYQKREVAKTVRNYSATDLAAILGLPDSAPTAPNAEGAAGWAALTGISNPACAAAAAANSSSSSDGDSSSSDSDDNEDSSEQRLRPGTPPGSETPPGRVLHSGQAGDTAAAGEEEDADADADAGGGSVWWRSVFVRGGRSGGSVGPSGKTRINISGFQEDDQANLYMQAHDAAVKNKQGLGRAGMPKKVAGARWQGKKTKLGSDDEDDEQQEQEVHQQAEQHPPAGVADGREVFTRNGITIVMPSKVQQQQPSHEQQQQQEGVEQQQGRGQRSGRQKRRRSAADDAEETVVRSTTPAGEALATPVCGSKENKQSRQQQMRSSAQEPVSSSAQKVKWAKLAAKILEGAPKKRMRVQKLHRKVLAVAGFDVDAPGVDTEALYQKMLKKLRKSEGLQVCEKYVAMA